MANQQDTRAPFAAHTVQSDKSRSGRTSALATQLEIRSGGNHVDPALRAWIYERMGRQLGKYAPQIERVDVRFGDENGPRGGNDKCCLVHIILSKLPPVVVEMRGETEREAFDLAANRAERATRRNMEKHGYSTKHHKHKEHDMHALDGMASSEAGQSDGAMDASEGGLFGRREGHGHDDLMALLERPQRERRDVPVDTAEPGTGADDRKVGADHTALRNTKLNTAGMAYALEDSTTGRPSRKSTRAGTNRIKHATQLTQRTKASVHSPKSEASRATIRGH